MSRTNVAGTTAPSGSGAQRCAQAGEREHRTDSTARDISPTNDGRNSLTATPTQLIGLIKAHIAKGDKAKEKADQHYIAAGQHLRTLKAEHTGTWAEWEALLKEKIGIGKSRASELMAIADGTKTVKGTREEARERMREIRARVSPERSGENADDPETSAETMKAELARANRTSDPDAHRSRGTDRALKSQENSEHDPRAVPPPAAASKKSWRVELTTDDSKRLVNGVRLETKAEAALYAAMGICDLLRPLWELDHEPPIVVMTRVLASADTVNCDVRYPKKNRRAQLRFSHGECHLHVWHPEDETGPSCPAAAAPTDDGLDIPGCLRRRP